MLRPVCNIDFKKPPYGFSFWCGRGEFLSNMHTDNTAESAPILIGREIEAELRRLERSVAWFSRKLHCDRRNVYDIFSREYIDTGLLYRISTILGKDFFALYSERLKLSDNNLITPPRLSALSLIDHDRAFA